MSQDHRWMFARTPPKVVLNDLPSQLIFAEDVLNIAFSWWGATTKMWGQRWMPSVLHQDSGALITSLDRIADPYNEGTTEDIQSKRHEDHRPLWPGGLRWCIAHLMRNAHELCSHLPTPAGLSDTQIILLSCRLDPIFNCCEQDLMSQAFTLVWANEWYQVHWRSWCQTDLVEMKNEKVSLYMTNFTQWLFFHSF